MSLKNKLILSVLVLSMFQTQVVNASISGIRSINNYTRGLDYKLDLDILKSVSDTVQVEGTDKELFTDSVGSYYSKLFPETNSTDSDSTFSKDSFDNLPENITQEQLAWLLDHNIISRNEKFVISNGIVESSEGEYLFNTHRDSISKTDFMTSVYKSVFGIIPSRPIIFNYPSIRDVQDIYYIYNVEKDRNEKFYKDIERKRVSDTGEVYGYLPQNSTKYLDTEFLGGDYHIFVSPNVTELYLEKLLEKSLINIDELDNRNFQDAYKSMGESNNSNKFTYPSWSTNLPPFIVTSGRSQRDGDKTTLAGTLPLGDSFSITGVERGSTRGNITGSVKVERTDKNYFKQEVMDSIEALKIVEKFMRLTEKDMTDTEATVVSYKYGVKYLKDFEDSDRKTIAFLTAKGILNFEDPSEYINLYGKLTKSFAYKLVYRLANKSARMNFSEIQLTDSDIFWIDQGFSSIDIKINEITAAGQNIAKRNKISELPEVITEKVEELDSINEVPLTINEGMFSGNYLMTTLSSLSLNRILSSATTPNSSEKSPNSSPTTKVFEITKRFDDKEKYRYNGVLIKNTEELKSNNPEIKTITEDGKSLVIVFSVSGKNAFQAIRSVDSKVQVASKSLYTTSVVAGVTKFSNNGEEVTLIPSTSIKRFSSTITAIADKVLVNSETGSTAILLPDSNMAIVGTHVIVSEDLMVFRSQTEVYYNLKILKTLLSNYYISELDPNGIYKTGGMVNEKKVDILGSSGSVVDSSYTAQFEGVFTSEGDPYSNSTSKKEVKKFVNLSSMNTSANVLIRDWDITNNITSSKGFRIVLKLNYILPDEDISFTDPKYSESSPSLDTMNRFLITRPEDTELQDWWDNNIVLSNALVNTMFSTSGVTYITSGYLVPSLSILYDSKSGIDESDISGFFVEVGRRLSSSWVDTFIGSSDYNQVIDKSTNYFTDPENKGKFYPEVAIKTKQFPLWVGAMFNNSTGLKYFETKEVLDSYTQNQNNSNLWRYLMARRTLEVLPSTNLPSGVKHYYGVATNFVETNSGALFVSIDEDNLFLPMKENKDGTISLTTRSDRDNLDFWENKDITYQTESFFVKSISSNKIELLDNRRLRGSVVESVVRKNKYDVRGTLISKNKNDMTIQTTLEDRYKFLYNIFSSDNLFITPQIKINYSKAMTPLNEVKHLTSESRLSDMTTIGGYFYVETIPIVYTDQTKLFRTYSITGEAKSLNFKELKKLQTSNPTVSAYTYFTLDGNYWTISDNGVLMPRRTYPYLKISTVYYSSLNQGIIDSILDSVQEVKKPSELVDGERLLVGDIMFTKVGAVFVSDPVGSKESLKIVKSAGDLAGTRQRILKLFSGLNITTSKEELPLSSFITEPNLSIPVEKSKLDQTLAGTPNSKTSLFVYRTSNNKTVREKYETSKSAVIKSVVFQIKLDDTLRIRPVIGNTNLYILSSSTNTLSQGYLKAVPFFTEKLNFSESDDILFSLNQSNFKGFAKTNLIQNEFLKSVKDQETVDFLTVVKRLIYTVLSFAILISWFCYMILNRRVFAGFFEIIRTPRLGSSGGGGIDLVKYISLGVYNMDSKVSLARTVFTTFSMCLLMYILERLA